MATVTAGQINGGVGAAVNVVTTAENYGKGAPDSTAGAMAKGAVGGAATGASIGAIVGVGVLSVPAAAAGAIIGGVIGGFVGLFSNNSKKAKIAQALALQQANEDVTKGLALMNQTQSQMLALANIVNGGFWAKFHQGIADDKAAESKAVDIQQNAPEYGVIISVVVLTVVLGYEYIFKKH